MDDTRTRDKPALTLLKREKTLDLDALARMFERLTGRRPSPEQIERARRVLDQADKAGETEVDDR